MADVLVNVQRRYLDLLAEHQALSALLREVARSGVEHIGTRYVTVQIDHATWADVQRRAS